MARSFAKSIQGNEAEAIQFIELHRDKPWEIEEHFGYRFYGCISNWYETQKPNQEPHYSSGRLEDRLLDAVLAKIEKLKAENASLKMELEERDTRIKFLEAKDKFRDKDWQRGALEVYQVCQS
jgi:predicted RNase H-like nuclease (RuvC/YqgF family)